MLTVYESLTPDERRKLEQGVVEVTGEAKNRTFLGIVAAIFKLYPHLTFAELKEMLPDTLNPKSTNRVTNFFSPFTERLYGVVQPGSIRQEIANANRVKQAETGAEEHYKMVHFTGEGETFLTSDGVEVLVANVIEDVDLQLLIRHVSQYGVRVVDFAPYRGGGRKGFYKLEVVDPAMFDRLHRSMTPPPPKATAAEPAPKPVPEPLRPASGYSGKVDAAVSGGGGVPPISSVVRHAAQGTGGKKMWLIALAILCLLLLLFLLFIFLKDKDNTVRVGTVPQELSFRVAGQVRDRYTGRPIGSVAISMTGTPGTERTATTNDSGAYILQYSTASTQQDLQLVLNFEKEGYLAVGDTIVFKADSTGARAMERHMFMEPNVKRAILLPRIKFDVNRYALRPEAKDSLEGLYRTLLDDPRLRVEVRAHTDSRPATRFPGGNPALSRKRAESCVAYLVERGIDPARLVALGMGSDEPLIPMDSIKRARSAEEKERLYALNRRSDFRVLDNDTLRPQ